MARIEDQRILVWCNRVDNIQQTIIDALFFALKFEKEVCFFANYHSDKEKVVLENQVNSLINVVRDDFPDLQVSKLLLKGRLHKLISELGEQYNSIMFCTSGFFDRELLKAFYRSGFPFYFSRSRRGMPGMFEKVIIPIDFRSSTKESVLWGSYLGRFCQSEVRLLKAKDTDNELFEKVESVELFSTKLYNQFSFPYSIEEGAVSSWKIHHEAIYQTRDAQLLIFTGSLDVSLADKIAGPFEQRMLKKADHISVLVINPQREMYVMCS
jgi:hypothetical protein